MSSCGHNWQPIQSWYGRYRCSWCKALGYRQIVNGGARGNPMHIVVYVCSRSGCHEPAISAGKDRQLCAEHQPPRITPTKSELVETKI